MPIYEYVCAGCGEAFEELVRTAQEERRLECPKCGGKQVTRQFSVIAAPRVAATRPAGPPPGPCGQCGSADGACPFR